MNESKPQSFSENSENRNTAQSENQAGAHAASPADLRAILLEDVEAPLEAEHPSNEQYLKLQRLLLQEASTLAEKIFDLTNQQREAKLEVYLKTINDVVLARPSFENQFILQNMQKIFTDTYGNYIKHLGHNPDVLEQIVHRTGKESRDIVARTLSGFDATDLAENIRARALTSLNDASKITARLMYDLTHQQVRELRAEYNSLPAREVARLVYRLLNRKDLRGRPYPDTDMLAYVLKYRTRKELAQIEFQYNELYHFVYDRDRQLCLREQIQASFKEAETTEILKLLEGFDPNPLAAKIYEFLSNPTSFKEGLGTLNSTRLHNDFSVNFRRIDSEQLVWQRELAVQPLIKEQVAHLSADQFKAVCAILKSKYDIELSPHLYPTIGKFNARQLALDLFKTCSTAKACPHFRRDEQYLSDQEIVAVKDEFRLSRQSDLADIIKITAAEKKAREATRRAQKALSPLAFLDPDQISLVAEQFKNIFGYSLNTFIQKTVAKICHNENLAYVNEIIALLTSGLARQKIKIDVFGLFASKLKRQQELDQESKEQKLINSIPRLVELLTCENQLAEGYPGLLNFIRELSPGDLEHLEALCANSKKDALPFLQGIGDILPAEITAEISLLFKSVDAKKIASNLVANPACAIDYLYLDTYDIYLVLREVKNLSGKDYLEILNESPLTSDPDQAKLSAHCKIIALSEQAMLLRDFLLSSLAGKNQEELALEILTRQKSNIEIFENCYNFYYGNYAPCYEHNQGALLAMLRFLVSEQLISRLFFSKSINLLEKLDKGVTENLYRHIFDPKISDELLESFQNWLRTYKSNLSFINKSYNALDAECTLRERIYAFSRSMQEINKTLLLFDGFDADLLTQHVRQLVEEFNSAELGNVLVDFLLLSDDQAAQTMIPSDPNWTHEMYHQLRCSYEEQYGTTLISDLVQRQVPLTGKGINKLAHLLYGEISVTALQIYKLQKEQGKSTKERMQLIQATVTRLDPENKGNLIKFYNDYIVAIGKGAGLLADLEQAFSNQLGYSELISSFSIT